MQAERTARQKFYGDLLLGIVVLTLTLLVTAPTLPLLVRFAPELVFALAVLATQRGVALALSLCQPDGEPLCNARDPGARLRDIAAVLGITERSAHGIVTDLTAAGYVVKQKDGRRNRYQVQAHLPLPEPATQEPAIGEVPGLLAGAGARLPLTGTGPG